MGVVAGGGGELNTDGRLWRGLLLAVDSGVLGVLDVTLPLCAPAPLPAGEAPATPGASPGTEMMRVVTTGGRSSCGAACSCDGDAERHGTGNNDSNKSSSGSGFREGVCWQNSSRAEE